MAEGRALVQSKDCRGGAGGCGLTGTILSLFAGKDIRRRGGGGEPLQSRNSPAHTAPPPPPPPPQTHKRHLYTNISISTISFIEGNCIMILQETKSNKNT